MEPASAIVSNAGLPDVIAYVWYQLGYQPQDSLVLVGVHGPDYRLGVIARSDLPGPRVRRSLLATEVRSLARSLVAAGAGQVLALLSTAEVLHAPEPSLVRVLTTELPRAGLRVMDVIGIGRGGYRSLLCHDRACCPAGGIPLDDVLATRTAATEVLFGRTVAASEAALIADVIPDGAVSVPDDADAGQPDRQRSWAIWSDVIRSGQQVPDVTARALARSLADARLRDAVLLNTLGAPAARCLSVLDGGSRRTGGGFDALLVEVLERQPGAGALRAARALLASVARAAPAGQRAPVLSILAVLAWFEGSGVRARLLTDQALADRPGYPLALLVRDLLVHAVIPPWVLGAGDRHREGD